MTLLLLTLRLDSALDTFRYTTRGVALQTNIVDGNRLYRGFKSPGLDMIQTHVFP